MSVDDLYQMVTDAILRAEAYEDLQAPGTASAYMDVSLLEEEIAKRLPASEPEGRIARRGAVRAAVTAKDYGRASRLIEKYSQESGCSPESCAQLHALLTPATREIASEESSDDREIDTQETVYVIRVERISKSGKSQAHVINLRTNARQTVQQLEDLGRLLKDDEASRAS